MLASPQVRRFVSALGLAGPLTAVRGRFPSSSMRRDMLDNAHLRVVLSAILAEDSNCVDIGANVGGVLGRIVELAPHGCHVAFEPISQLAADLRERYPHVTVHELALSNAPSQADFTFVRSRPGYSGLRERRYPGRETLEKIQVKVERLDDVLDPDYIPAFVKIDVEGAELQVLQGAVDTLRRSRPIIVFEHGLGAADCYGAEPQDVYDLLVDEVGLRIFDLDGGGPYSRDGFIASFRQAVRWNYLARP